MHFTRQLFLVIVLLSTAATLAACGQKGPLYIPDEKQHNEQNQNKS